MNKKTIDEALKLIKKHGPIGPTKLAEKLQISTQMAHRHIKSLLKDKKIKKIGSPPKVFYVTTKEKGLFEFPKLKPEQEAYINEHYLAVKPDGEVLEGLRGFQWWAEKTKQHKNFTALANEYVSNHSQCTKEYKNKLGIIDATRKLKDTFENCYLDYIFYQSFYSIPKFGKTKTGQMVTLGKSGQDIENIKLLAQMCRQSIIDIVEYYKIDGLIFTPHSIPRKISFLKEFKRFLSLPYPTTGLNKVFAGKAPVAQKSLSKLADRIENANNTIFLREENYHFKRILVIDDAVGSGATLNAIAHKLKTQANAEFVCGFAVTGSLKGFDVISEI